MHKQQNPQLGCVWVCVFISLEPWRHVHSNTSCLGAVYEITFFLTNLYLIIKLGTFTMNQNDCYYYYYKHDYMKHEHYSNITCYRINKCVCACHYKRAEIIGRTRDNASRGNGLKIPQLTSWYTAHALSKFWLWNQQIMVLSKVIQDSWAFFISTVDVTHRETEV